MKRQKHDEVITVRNADGELIALVEPESSEPLLTRTRLKKFLPRGWIVEVKNVVEVTRFEEWALEKGLAVHGQRLIEEQEKR